MEASDLPHLSLLLTFCLFSVSHAYGIPLLQGWSFSADLSLSSPLPRNAYTSPSLSLFAPVLSSLSFSSGKGFSLGFLSLFDDSPKPSPTGIFLTICLGTNKSDSMGRSFAVPVWNLDRQRPLKQVGQSGRVSLVVNSTNKDLLLRDGDGSVVWKVSNVEAMEMQDSGNWAIYNSNNEVVWQSFDHPGSTLVQGQTLALGKKLVSNNSLFTVEMMPGGLVFYMNSESPATLAYWAVPINVTVTEYVLGQAFDLSKNPPVNLTASFETFVCPPASKGFIQPYATLRGENFTVQGGCSSYQWSNFANTYLNSTFNSDFLILANNGYPEGYTYLHQHGANYLFSAQSGTSYCLAPNSCGAYGICSEYMLGTQHTCHCPSSQDNPAFVDAFNLMDPSDPTQGCQRATPLDCSSNARHTLVEIQKTTFTPIHVVFETTFMQNTLPLGECIAHCTSNCSCSGFFYHRGSSYCLPFSDTTGLSNLSLITLGNEDFSTYIKIQYSAFSAPSSHSNYLDKPVVFAIAGITLVIITCLIIISIRRYSYIWRLKDMDSESEMDEGELQEILPLLPTRYTYMELFKITSGFSKLVGTGGCGSVYQGVLADGRKVAVKKLDQGPPRLKQFLAEVVTIGGVSHYNIAPLFGFCSQKAHRLLVYEFMDNGSLDQWLFSEGKERLLSWATRFQVALGTARGLAYLHEGCPRPIIHFDVKPQNILLDKDCVAKLSDFGLSKLVARESSFVMTGVRGTPGYLAPEWLSHSAVTNKCDVYSFGMVLLELVGGRRNAVQSLVGSDQWYFPMWAALKCKQGLVLDLVDQRLNGSFDEAQVKRIVRVAFLCIQKEPTSRPSMDFVCRMIEGTLSLIDVPPPPFSLDLDILSPEAQASLASCSTTLMEGR